MGGRGAAGRVPRAYLILSRRGYASSDRHGMAGFYDFYPENTSAWRAKNDGSLWLFGPLDHLDRAAGFGRAPASEPQWGLSR